MHRAVTTATLPGMLTRRTGAVCAVAWLTLAAASAQPTHINIPGPTPGVSVIDTIDAIDAEREKELNELCQRLLDEHATQMLVVTIDLMAEYGHDDIDEMAHALFNQWQVGLREIHGQDWDTGVMVLFSRLDRRVKIELGRGLGRRYDAAAARVIEQYMKPDFLEGNFGHGLVAGAVALDKMVRGEPLPQPPGGGAVAPRGETEPRPGPTAPQPVPSSSGGGIPWWAILLIIIVVVVLLKSRGGGGLSLPRGRWRLPRLPRGGGFGGGHRRGGGFPFPWPGGSRRRRERRDDDRGGAGGGWGGGGSGRGGGFGGGFGGWTGGKWSGGGSSGGGGASGSW